MTTRQRRLLLLSSLLLPIVALLAAVPAPAARADAPPTPTPPRITVLPTGLTVATDTHPDMDTVSIAVSVHAGARNEDPSFRGGAHWLEHLHFLGSQKYPSQSAIFSAITDAGGTMDASTDSEATTYYVTVPTAAFTTGLDVLSDIMVRPLFPPDLSEQEKGVVLDEIEEDSGSSVGATLAALGQQLIGPVAQDASGTPKSVSALKLQDALVFSARYYVAPNMAVAVVGPLSPDYVEAAVAYDFYGLPTTPAPAPPPPPAPTDSLRLQGSSPLLVIVGQRLPGLNSPDWAALEVLDAILDVPGTRMSDAIEAGRTTTNGGTIISLYSDIGLWVTHAFGDPDEVLAIVQQQLQLLQTRPVPADEVHAAEQYFAGRILLGAERSYNRAGRLARSTVLGVPLTAEQAAAAVLAVTPQDVQRVAQTYFSPGTLSIVAPKPRSASQ